MSIERLLFMGSPLFACPTLEALISQFPDTEIMVFSRADAPIKRSKKPVATAVKSLALSRGLSVLTPENKEDLSMHVKTINPDLIIVVAYGMILPRNITDTYFCINGHGSILPQYRGASPIQASLLHQDTETGITLIKMNEKMDEGNLLSLQTCPIKPDNHLGDLTDRLSQLCAKTIIDFLNAYPDVTSAPLKAQNHQEASYCKKIQASDLCLDDLTDPYLKLARIKAFSPRPGAYLTFQNKRLKILKASVVDNKLIPELVQPEGKNVMCFDDFCLGNPQAKDTLF